jgi:glucans biosynthesis protein
MPSLATSRPTALRQTPTRRLTALACAVMLANASANAQESTQPFDFSALSKIAWSKSRQNISSAPGSGTAKDFPDALRNLSYDQMRDIRFKPDQAIWRQQGLPFEVMFFHLGKFQTEAVRVHEITNGQDHVQAWSPSLFDYGHNQLATASWGDIGFAGLRLHYPLNNPDYKDELAVFQGASYFRALGRSQRYGLSARGLAIDTVGAGAEEFPRFTEFWLERPKADATSVQVYALLESAHATGAYRFVMYPGDDTVIDVQARLFLRDGITTLGLAPLTSMFKHGANQPVATDFRPEVHDSDGLMMALSQENAPIEWLWRPLGNPSRLLVTSFHARQLGGFGLMQRNRNYTTYQDSEARYERRPSVWIEPTSAWGSGRVELVQIPTPDETNDNIVAYWVPDTLPKTGLPLDISYRMHWQGDGQQTPPASWVVQTRRGHGFIDPQHPLPATQLQFLVDFDGPALRALPANTAVTATVSVNDNATLLEANPFRNPVDGTWRLSLRLDRRSLQQPVEIRAHLQSHLDLLSETWTTILPSE